MIRMLLTGRMVCVCQYLAYERGQDGTLLACIDRWRLRSSKEVDFDILA
jgi:hypothetical protein